MAANSKETTRQRLRGREELAALERSARERLDRVEHRLIVCAGTGCRACGCLAVATEAREAVDRMGLADRVEVLETGCHGFCEQGPLVLVRPGDLFYPRVKPKQLEAIIEESVIGGRPVEPLLYRDPRTGEPVAKEGEIPFYSHQTRYVFGLNGSIDPTRIEDYVAFGGYEALARALFDFTPEAIVEEVAASGLKGRGGGGFPTGRKWATCRDAKGERRYVICNADEGDPGAFMDRSLLEGNPHRVIEGMLIGALAIGADEGFVYVRDEYPLAVKHIGVALEQARTLSLLGPDILGSGFSFDIRVNRGGGAFVCGESTALMASLEGRVGEPRAKYVHTVEEGLRGEPSNLNNVETWANVPLIVRDGVAAFSAMGTETSKGTKIFSLVGKVNNTGLVEVAMGMTLREIVEEIGGGLPEGSRLKAVQTGGPSGGCLPEGMMDLPVDFERLTEAGSMMGSGGLIVMDQKTCMVDVARYFVHFLNEESCGKCVPCRSGLAAMLERLERICEGRGASEDIDFLAECGRWMEQASLCALGTTAANPVLSTLRYFRAEYDAHVHEQRCPAGVCTALITYRIKAELCDGCRACAKVCPEQAIEGEKKNVHRLYAERCIKCGACMAACRQGAVERT